MGAVARTRPDGFHESTGKLGIPQGITHEPMWGKWMHEWFGIEVRQCQHPDCDVEDYRKML